MIVYIQSDSDLTIIRKDRDQGIKWIRCESTSRNRLISNKDLFFWTRNISNNNSSREMNNNHRQYHSDDDHISYNNEKAEDKSVARTVISESCKTVSDKLNKKYPSVSGTSL